MSSGLRKRPSKLDRSLNPPRAGRQADTIWNEADKQFDESELATLVLAIANINVWNRLNIAVWQPAGAWKA